MTATHVNTGKYVMTNYLIDTHAHLDMVINKDEENICFAVDAGLGHEHAPCIVAQCDGIVYLGSRRGIIVAIDPQKQKVLWSYRLGTSEVNGFEKANGKLYASLTEGCIWEISKNK